MGGSPWGVVLVGLALASVVAGGTVQVGNLLCALDNGTSVAKCLGVKYGVISERWTAPSSAGWPSGSLVDATVPGYGCPQANTQYPGSINGNVSEDCLNMDIYVPLDAALRPKRGSPMMLFFVGGALLAEEIGQARYANGQPLAESQDVVLMLPNYRVGVLGFAAFDELRGAEGNGYFGMLDQRLAIEWAHVHAARVGGDRSRITIAGQSAGGWSVAWHMAQPVSEQLWSTAIMFSGNTVNQWVFREEDTAIANDMTTIGVGLGLCTDLACLRGLPLTALYPPISPEQVAVLDFYQLGPVMPSGRTPLQVLSDATTECSHGIGMKRVLFHHLENDGAADITAAIGLLTAPGMPWTVPNATDHIMNWLAGTATFDGEGYPLLSTMFGGLNSMVHGPLFGHLSKEQLRTVWDHYLAKKGSPFAAVGALSTDVLYKCPMLMTARVLSTPKVHHRCSSSRGPWNTRHAVFRYNKDGYGPDGSTNGGGGLRFGDYFQGSKAVHLTEIAYLFGTDGPGSPMHLGATFDPSDPINTMAPWTADDERMETLLQGVVGGVVKGVPFSEVLPGDYNFRSFFRDAELSSAVLDLPSPSVERADDSGCYVLRAQGMWNHLRCEDTWNRWACGHLKWFYDV